MSLASVYNKLNALEVGTSAALVDFAAQRSRKMIDAMDGGLRELLAGVTVRVLDGNCLDGRQHRLKVTRQSTAAPLPGKALVVFDPQRETMEAKSAVRGRARAGAQAARADRADRPAGGGRAGVAG